MPTRQERSWAASLDADSSAALVRLDDQLEESLRCHLDRLKKRSSPRGKAIHDLVWGFVELSGGEIAILDSPVLQRLRFVRQLGLAYLLFPAAGYSRFEHSLGVCFAVGRMVESLDSHAREDGLGSLSCESYRLLRYAALLHDVGHMAFSHASERCWEQLGDAGRPVLAWAEAIGASLVPGEPAPAPAEALSVAIATSSPMVRLLGEALRVDGVELEGGGSLAAETISRLIIGAPCDGELHALRGLLCGPMDADKMDYLARDSLVTGVNLTGDLTRLMTKLRLSQDGRTLRLTQSGEEALSDLLMSREILTQRIYRHPKVLAAEGLLEQALARAAAERTRGLTPHELLWDGDDVLLHRLANSTRPQEARRILNRDLPKRALVARPSDQSDGETARALSSLCRALKAPAAREAFRDKIIGRMVDLGVDRSACEWVLIAAESGVQTSVSSQALYQQYRAKHESLFVFADEMVLAQAHAAALDLLRKEHELDISVLAARRAKLSDEDLSWTVEVEPSLASD